MKVAPDKCRMMSLLSKWQKNKLLSVLIGLGVLSAFYFFAWWFESDRIYHPALLVFLVLAIGYCAVQVFSGWYIFLQAEHIETSEPAAGLTVDVFVPTYDEPLWVVERTLTAVLAMHYPHQTYVLDDGRKAEYRELAKRLGACYISRPTNEDHKAGNINHALAHTNGEFIAIFDVDHVPASSFLDRALGPFRDAKIGFVQVKLEHYNQGESFVAAAADQRNDGFFGAPMLGLNGCDCAQAFGSNCVFRRKALEAIGGYKPGLAEDVDTSIHMHAAGWRSAYVPEALAEGLEPADLDGFFKQQLKWSRGVFDLLFRVYPRLAKCLSLKMNVGYLWRLSCYLAGPMVLLQLLFTILALFLGVETLTVYFAEYLIHQAPFVLISSLIGFWADKRYHTVIHPSLAMPFGGLLLAYGTWPIYTLSFICAIFGVKIPFMATPKQSTGGNSLNLIVPHIITVVLLLAAVAWRLSRGVDYYAAFICAFALMNSVMHGGVFYAAWEGRRIERSRNESNEKDRNGTSQGPPTEQLSSLKHR